MISTSNNIGAIPGSADADNIIFTGGTLNTSGTFSLGSNKRITMTSSGTINTNSSTTLTYAGIITGSGSITKAGAGALILSGNNTYTGDTTIFGDLMFQVLCQTVLMLLIQEFMMLMLQIQFNL